MAANNNRLVARMFCEAEGVDSADQQAAFRGGSQGACSIRRFGCIEAGQRNRYTVSAAISCSDMVEQKARIRMSTEHDRAIVEIGDARCDWLVFDGY